MDDCYRIAAPGELLSPSLVVFRDLVIANIDSMIEIAGSPDRLRPHCKTHKVADVAKLQIQRGITKQKCATFAEAEMLAEAGVADIFLAYNLVGPNINRAVDFVARFPSIDFMVTADHQQPIADLGQAMSAAGREIGVLLDIDTGQHRTGLPAGDAAATLYRQIAATPGLQAAGLHVYDGHQHQSDRGERAEAIHQEWSRVADFRQQLADEGLAVPRIVAGGTASFPVYAAMADATIECSPGTCVYHDVGYGESFPDLVFQPAALLFTRVVSRPTDDRITLDLGYKAVASDPPAGRRLRFPDLPDAVEVLQNEEHLVLQTEQANRFVPGDYLLAVPRHICPTSALHKDVYVIDDGALVDRWGVVARDRMLTI